MPGLPEHILERLPSFRETAEELQDLLLANLVMLGEIPAPTFEEEARVRFLQDRFSAAGLQNCSSDEVGNGLAILPGSEGESHIMVVAHVDSVAADVRDLSISVKTGHVIGSGVADNSLGVAVLATLPSLLERLGIQLKSNLILMGGARSLGRGNLEGLRFFLANNDLPIQSGVCVEGVQLGRLSYSSIGMLRGDVNCSVPEEYDWTRFGAAGAIAALNDVINQMFAIALPRRPTTSIVLGSIHGGHSYSSVATEATLQFEIRSESTDMVRQLGRQLEDIASEVSARTRADVAVDIFAEREPGGIDYGHPLCRSTRAVMGALGLEPRIGPSTSELAAFIDHHIPAVTLGLTRGEQVREKKDDIQIAPMFTGIAQLVGVLLAMDEGGGDHGP